MHSVEIRELIPSDKTAALALLNQVFGDIQRSDFTRGDAFWDWKYDSNVFGKPILIVATVKHQLVGFSTLWPWSFKYRGGTYNGLQPCDSVVHKKYQKYGIFSQMRLYGLQKAAAMGCDIIFNFPNSNSLPSYLNMGWDYLGKLSWYVCLLNPLVVITSRFIKSKSKPITLDSKYNLDCDFLQQLGFSNIDYSKFFTTHYVPGYFNWRYNNHPSLRYGMIAYKNGHKSIAAIFNIKQNGAVREMVIVDVIGNFSSFGVILPIIKQAAKECRADFFAIISSKKFPKFNPLLRGILPMKNKRMTVLPLNISLEPHLTSINNWNLIAAMHDSI